MEYASRTQHYQKVKKPLLERQRRARINKCLDALKQMVAELQNDETILRMDKAEMLETTINFLHRKKSSMKQPTQVPVDSDSFRHGYMNAVNEVSRVLASTEGVTVDFGKSIMIHLGCQFNRLQDLHKEISSPVVQETSYMTPVRMNNASDLAPMSPASSGYHSDMESPAPTPVPVVVKEEKTAVWRPW